MENIIKNRNEFISNRKYFVYIDSILLDILSNETKYDILTLTNAINQLDSFEYLYGNFVWNYTLDQFLLLISKIDNENYTYKLILSYLIPKTESVALSDEINKEEVSEVKNIITKLNNLGYSIDRLLIIYAESNDLEREVEYVVDFILRYTPNLLHFKYLSDELNRKRSYHIVTMLVNEYILHQV